MKRLRVLTLISFILAVSIFYFKTRTATIAAGPGLVVKKEWLQPNRQMRTPAADCRPPDQTFLTFPEWYLVFSPEEQAAYFKEHTATSFPFMSHTMQIWQSYKIINDQIRDNFPVNNGYHFMIWVIGTSASVEYIIKAFYETVIGRMTDTRTVITDEDAFNAKYTQDYVDFIKDYPWYAFDFKSRLGKLWCNTSITGNHLLRKMERRYILTSELLVKWGYGKLIGLGTKTVYDEALPVTAVILDKFNPDPSDTSIKINKRFEDGSVLIYLPRYDKFNPVASELAKLGAGFKEIAGNTSAIVLTVLVPLTKDSNYGAAQIIFTQPLVSDHKIKRVALAIPVSQLSSLLMQMQQNHIKIEHVFDY